LGPNLRDDLRRREHWQCTDCTSTALLHHGSQAAGLKHTQTDAKTSAAADMCQCKAD